MKSLLPSLQNGYHASGSSSSSNRRRSLDSIVVETLLRLFSLRNVAFVMFISVYTVFLLLLRDGSLFDETKLRRGGRNVVIRNVHDYDVGCNGYSMEYRLKEQQRILQSVRSELIESSAKLKEVNAVYEELNKKIPEKQLSGVLEEIESARRTLEELRDRRNVRVFLPHRPIYPDVGVDVVPSHPPRLATATWETAIDYRPLDYNVFLGVPMYNASAWMRLSSLLPFARKDNDSCYSAREKHMRESTFCVLFPSKNFSRFFWETLREGCIPVVLSMDIRLPFQDDIDWNLASIRIASSRLPEMHFILRSLDMAEVLEMRRMGRVFFERYLGDVRGGSSLIFFGLHHTTMHPLSKRRGCVAFFTTVIRTLLASLRKSLGIPPPPENVDKAIPLFNDSFTAPILTPVNAQHSDEEYLGPLEAAVDSPTYLHNFSLNFVYAYRSWNVDGVVGRAPEFLIHSVDPPAESEIKTFSGFRPIEPGSGVEFSKALGGNRPREQFTGLLLLLFFMFIKVSKNSLNNRFVPWDRIRTEAVLSLDDDIDLKQHEIIFAFRVWRENRHRIVGFPARHHTRYGDEIYYNSNHTCQLSIILTGAAFLHKSYLQAYTHEMPEAIRQHVDEVTNCEDIAMNFLVSHRTREPPIKTTSKWTLR
ncbi:unnamed protein product [Nippostrongylus brasiliensis]|uniref:Exostosin-2 (inferred by orthology to a C. elegans protein) n=1 Tax=Nippostrongylus brasiliensis TaxID=27835 RepID=A0A0N4Y9W7_NIPBR|nr:unnamed protein product [Nippostrongylus brasiliensis]